MEQKQINSYINLFKWAIKKGSDGYNEKLRISDVRRCFYLAWQAVKSEVESRPEKRSYYIEDEEGNYAYDWNDLTGKWEPMHFDSIFEAQEYASKLNDYNRNNSLNIRYVVSS